MLFRSDVTLLSDGFLLSKKSPLSGHGQAIPLILEECREGAAFFFDLASAGVSSKISEDFNEPGSAPLKILPRHLEKAVADR